MAQEDVPGGVAPQSEPGDGEGAEWVAPEPELKGPKRRPGPNDAPEAAAEFIQSLSPEEQEEFKAELAGKLVEGIEPRSEEEKTETIAKLKAAGFVTAADLLPPDPLEGIPQEPPDEDTPPDEASPTFLVRRNRYGPGSHSVLLANGEPVGQWLSRVHHDLSGERVEKLLLEMGLEEDLAADFARRRDQRLEADKTLAGMPAIAEGLAEEGKRLDSKEQVRAAFIKAQKAKQAK